VTHRLAKCCPTNYGAYLTFDVDVTADHVRANLMANGPVGLSLRNHTAHRGGSENVAEITEAALACSDYIATHY